MKHDIVIRWVATDLAKEFGYKNAEASISLWYEDYSDKYLLEDLFKQTNWYEGNIWDIIEPVLPADRTHTALSVGDEVEIDGLVYRCAEFGWEYLSCSDCHKAKQGANA